MSGYRIVARALTIPVVALGVATMLVHQVDPERSHDSTLTSARSQISGARVQSGAVEASGHAPGHGRVPRPRSRNGGCDSPAATTSRAATVVTCLPAVAFQKQIRVIRGRLRTALLVNIAEPGGRATLVGTSSCTVIARPGVVAWLNCRYRRGRGPLTISVTLADHRVIRHTATPVFGCVGGAPGPTASVRGGTVRPAHAPGACY